MDDLEITKACAEAMELRYHTADDDEDVWPGAVCTYNSGSNMWTDSYNPLQNDAQAMALVKKFRPSIGFGGVPAEWHVHHRGNESWGNDSDLNRAICLCVAKLKEVQG